MELRPVLMITGALTATLGCSMFLPAIADAMVGHPDWMVFVSAGLITSFVGAGVWTASSGGEQTMNARQAFLLTATLWIVLAFFAALPLYFSELSLSFTDAYFEAMSGLTTTGSTVITGLDVAPPGILLWRGLLQWFGGLGIVVMAIAVLPMLQIGGMQMFKAEAFDTPEKILPRAAQIAGTMTAIYLVLTGVCAAAYWAAGMGLFDAVVHAMTTVATGGYSTHDASIGHYDSGPIDYVGVTFMILGSLPFLLYIRATQGSLMPLFRDSQVRAFLGIVAVATLVLFYIQLTNTEHTGEPAFRQALFNSVSVITGTGYATEDYDNWGHHAIALMFVLTFLGGCAGSTSCGIKTFRLQVLYIELRQHVRQILFPSGVFVRRYNGRVLPDSVAASVMSFVFVYFVAFFLLALALSLTGLNPLESLSGAATSISNVGPGLGERIGPAGTFQSVNDTAKWILTAGMLLGRLELFTVLVVFMPRFWRA
ncbi:TrkH family potassium uptake protein [Cucumibacter marinus]|uniref:TrkH family potassium uptake protein n=1 Tax=Cucumibacter marinus TaxID=1121252 RepID=UPI00048D5B03|nr:TrkH family potassium uptake protein [Cucumibacter marinus]